MACASPGPGLTTWRLVNIRPRLASMTKPVAWAVVFHSVSKARVLSIWMVTTPVAMRSRVCAQFAGELGTPGGGVAMRTGGVAANADDTVANNKTPNSETRGMNVPRVRGEGA